ncbi:MAG: serine hydrolase domain-containing protein [Bacteroidota bacterium]|jgi:CubicO group peptidase (beta-lactamase class C family)
MKIEIVKITLLSLGLLFVEACSCWRSLPEQLKENATITELETYLNALVESGNPPGMSLVVVKDGKIVYEKGFGWADEPMGIASTPGSVYHWFSLTKIATAIAILQLQEQGKLQLEDSVRTYLPYFNAQYPSAHSKPVTIQHLLTHSSGLPDAGFRIISWIHHDGEPSVNQTVLVEKVLPDYSKLEFEPGDQTQYTNIGYMVLGAIIEKVTGQTYEDYIREHLLKPLAMNHTDFLYTKEMEPFEAAGSHPVFDAMTPFLPIIAGSYIREISGKHLWFERVYNDQTPSTGLIGSAMDAARLVAVYLNGGELDGYRILSPVSISRMTREGHIRRANDTSTNSRQGIGWQIYDNKGELTLRQSGGGPGYRTEMQLCPDKKLGFVLFTNDVTCESWKIITSVTKVNW